MTEPLLQTSLCVNAGNLFEAIRQSQQKNLFIFIRNLVYLHVSVR
jgi:hypothetical protein